VSPGRTFATARRVVTQLQHDPRTIALMLVVPCVLITLLKYMFEGKDLLFNSVAPMILGIFPLLMMFLVTSITTLRERRTGTLDRLLTMPISKLDFIFGYALAFSALALVQAVLVCSVTLGLLGVVVAGGTWPVLLSAVLAALLWTSLGLFVSAYASSEFQEF
jgi:ABC-2 type transport system permease protein